MIPVRRVLTAPVETIGAALPQTFADLGFPSGASAGDSGQVYLTPYLRIHGELYKGELNSVYIDCGHAPGGGHAADSYEVTFAMLVRLTPQDGDLVLVEVLIDGTARDRTLNLSNPVFCTGTGRLEREFLQRLEARIGARNDLVPYIRATVWGRIGFAVLLGGLVIASVMPKSLLLFAAIDVAGAVWTAVALRQATLAA
jgi:hypothetical protein